MTALCNSLIIELEAAVHDSSSEKRVQTLRRITDLFLGEADRLNDEQIAVFDDVLGALIQRIETKALAELSSRLAPVDNAPVDAIRRLARNDEIAVAGPVLTESSRLTADDLIDIAKTKGRLHMLAISGRSQLNEAVTDVLLNHGDREVTCRLASNSGAQFSDTGFEILIKAGETDATLAEKVGLRLDLPLRLLRELLSKATEAVRARLLSLSNPEAHEAIKRALTSISNQVAQEVTAPRNFQRAHQFVTAMTKNNQLDEAALYKFADGGKYEETVVALSLLSNSPIEIIKPLMQSPAAEGLLIACKAADLKWKTVSAILKNRFRHHSISDEDIAVCKTNFIALTKATAQRTLRFWIVRNNSALKTSAVAS
jgi:uncharacterized protein (DUF2336 family)